MASLRLTIENENNSRPVPTARPRTVRCPKRQISTPRKLSYDHLIYAYMRVTVLGAVRIASLQLGPILLRGIWCGRCFLRGEMKGPSRGTLRLNSRNESRSPTNYPQLDPGRLVRRVTAAPRLPQAQGHDSTKSKIGAQGTH